MTTTAPVSFYTDRSAIELDWTCGMAYYLNRIEGERGIVPRDEASFFLVGREIHEDMQWCATTPNPEVDIYPHVEKLMGPYMGSVDQLVLEPLYRRLGWITAFALYIEPKIRAEYDTIMLEKELCFDRDPLMVGVTPDRILRSKVDPKMIRYREYKSTITMGKKWQDYWPFAVQLHMGIAAAEEELKEEVTCAEIMGIYKGYEKDGKLRHPYVWAYYNPKTDEWGMEYKYGLTLRPTWEYPNGIVGWVQKCGPDVARDVFTFSRPVFKDVRLLELLVEQETQRAMTIAEVKEACRKDPKLRVVHFPMRFTKCRPAWGGPECPYLAACHNASVNQDPLGSGLYVPRTPHHDLELMGLGE